MAGETIITVVGNLTRDPELRTVGNGSTVVNSPLLRHAYVQPQHQPVG